MRPKPKESSKGLIEFLEQMRRDRDELNVLIAGIEKRIGVVSDGRTNYASMEAPSKSNASIDEIPVGFFHNLSQAAAAEKLLKLSPGHPLQTQEMLETFRKSGMPVNSKNSTTVLYTTLKRSPKFERVAGKAWGLSEWYPEKRKKQERAEIEELDSDKP
jgi:hypothetical protein